ncbi:MAG: type II toxin-antitoxin system RelE/ParE family toxin [Planctomycetes bacterium]|nr:type II toxin-antitoxin system RelE/ParE family toxin [Planctomycetota bacterium]
MDYTCVARCRRDRLFHRRRGRSPVIAEQILRELKDKAEQFAQQPELGEPRPDLHACLRCRPHKRWLVFYEPSATGITVHRVIDGSRDYPRLFGGEPE